MSMKLSTKLIVSVVLSNLMVLSAQADSREIRLGTSAWIGYAPFYVAEKMNMYEKYGVKVKLQDFADPALIPSAISSGSIQGAMYTYDQVISSNANGQKYKVVMPIDYSNGADALIADNSIKSVADLKGKKIAYPFSTCDNLLVVYALNKAGLKESDIQSVDTTPENVASVLAAGASAGATYEPSITKILKMGGGKKYHNLVTSKDAPGLITDVLYFNQSYIDKNPEVVRAVIKGYLDGLQYIKDKPTEARKLIAKFMSSSDAEVKAQQDGAYNIPAYEMSSYFVKRDDFKSLYKVADMINDILIKRGQIKTGVKAVDTFDSHFVKEFDKVAK